MPATDDMAAILQTVREVEASLDRRSARAAALVMVVWGIAVSFIFACYQWALMDRSSLERVIGAAGIPWLWLPPVVLAYLFTMLARVRLGRMNAKEGSASVARLLVTVLLPIAAILVIISTGLVWWVIPGMMVAYLGYTYIGWKRPHAPPSDRWLGYASLAMGAILLLPAFWAWSNGIASIWYALFLALPGMLRYHR